MEEKALRENLIKSFDAYLCSDKARSLKTVFYLALDPASAKCLLRALKVFGIIKEYFWIEQSQFFISFNGMLFKTIDKEKCELLIEEFKK